MVKFYGLRSFSSKFTTKAYHCEQIIYQTENTYLPNRSVHAKQTARFAIILHNFVTLMTSNVKVQMLFRITLDCKSISLILMAASI